MSQAFCFSAPALDEESFIRATLGFVRRCAARSDYIELCFATSEGLWKWCFPEPPHRDEDPAGPLALTVGRYGAQAHPVTDDGLGPALPSASALPMILGGADVYVARRLVARGL